MPTMRLYGSEPSTSGWHPIPPSEVAAWNDSLLGTEASLFQLPYWNEPLRTLHFRPTYLTYNEGGRPIAYVCVLELGVPGLRIALAPRGPVPLVRDGMLPASALHALHAWSARRGHIFLRLTHERADLLEQWAVLPGARRTDPFPLYSEPREELLVLQEGSDEQVAAAFQPVARRNLRHAQQVGYRIESDDSPALLTRMWPLFQTLSQRKNFRYRPLDSFLTLLRLARPHGGACTFAASFNDRPVQAIVVVRDGRTAHYIIGALDTDTLGDRESPSVLLHWLAMRHFAAQGTRYYDLGTRSGPVYRFKQKFRPMEREIPPPVVLVPHPLRFRSWSTVIDGGLRRAWPTLKRLIAR